jgi:hypothetical protein
MVSTVARIRVRTAANGARSARIRHKATTTTDCVWLASVTLRQQGRPADDPLLSKKGSLGQLVSGAVSRDRVHRHKSPLRVWH